MLSDKLYLTLKKYETLHRYASHSCLGAMLIFSLCCSNFSKCAAEASTHSISYDSLIYFHFYYMYVFLFGVLR